MTKNDETPKIGAGHAEAMLRQGLSELRGAFFNESNVAQPSQYGLYGTKTPGEVADARKAGEEYDRGEEPGPVISERLDQASHDPRRDAQERTGPERD